MNTTRALLAANVLVYLLQGMLGESLYAALALWPLGRHPVPELGLVLGFRPWQLVTYAFLHANLQHLALNMLGLWMFGRDVESLDSREGIAGGERYA